MKTKSKPERRRKKLAKKDRTNLRDRSKRKRPGAAVPESEADARRRRQELDVHQVELEMQNAEQQKTRDELEVALEKYTDLYDFAPAAYFSLDASGVILEVNLTGAALLGRERSRLINARLPRFLVRASRSVFMAFLKRVFAGAGKHACEVALSKDDGTAFWANLHGISAISVNGTAKWCRVAVSDITSLKQTEGAQRRVEALAVANQELRREIVRRQAVEESLRKSEQQQSRLLDQSRRMHEQLRHLSRQVLEAQEEERKKISRELHDVVAQTLTSIHVRLANLKKEAALNTKGLEQAIARTQQLVEQSVRIVHQFARELRPAVLDDLGLIPALHTFMKGFKKETGIHVSLSASAAVEQVNGDKRTVLYRVVQEALTNVARHAKASRVDVKIQKLGGAVCMGIKDNGKGFLAKRVLLAKEQKRLGLLGMRERVEMVGGTFTIESIPGKGTTVHTELPFGGAGGKPDEGTR